jgi:hypothetical protein
MFSIFFLHSLTGLFISFPISSYASCFLILLKCIGCFGSHSIFVYSFIKFDEFYDTFLSPLHFTITTLNKPHSTTDSHHSSRQKQQEWKKEERSGRRWWVTLHVQTCSGRIRIIPLMRWPNTDSTPNKSVTLPRKQLLIRYLVTSHVHTVTIRWYGMW